MKNKVLLAIAATLLLLCGCAKDQELYDKVNDLDSRVTALEEAIKELNQITIPGLQSIVAAIQGNIYVTSVTPNADGYVIVFSNSTTAVIKNGENGTDGTDGEKGDKGDTPDISIIEVDGEFYWALDGEPLLDAKGNKIPVYSALPQLRISEGKWQVSYDEGATWTDVEVLGEPGGSTLSIEDGDTTVTFYINGEAYEIQKELPFYIVFESRKDLGVPVGEEYMFEYSIQGVTEGDELEVDVLNCTAGWEARVLSLPQGDTPGYIGVTNLENKDGKVFIYASNGRGKTDIKSLLFEEGILKAEADVKEVPAEGGNVTISVTTNMGYELYVERTKTWISVAPASKATHTDVYTLVCEANETGSYRSAEVDIIDTQTNDVPQVFMILQYPSESVATTIASLNVIAEGATVALYSETVLAASENSAVVSDGTGYLYVTNASSVLPLGKTVTLNGVKRTAEDGSVYLELTSFEIDGATSDVTDPETTYYGLGQNGGLPLYTSVTGPLEAQGDEYVVTAVMGQKVTIEAPLSNYAVSSYVGKTVTIYGYLTSVNFPAGEDVENYTAIINGIDLVPFAENAAWTLSYVYDPESNASYPELVTNTVSGSTVPYQLGFYSEEEYAELGSPEAAALMMCDDLQYIYWYYGALGRDFIYSIFVHADGATGSENFSEVDYGVYYIVAVGTNPDGTATGDYKVQKVEKKEPVSVAAYEDFLGRWSIGGTTFTISEKVNGSTYNVSGFVGQSTYGVPDVEAEYVDGKFLLKEQDIDFTATHPTYGELTQFYLSGVFTSNSKIYSAYPVNSKEPSVIFTTYILEGGDVLVVKGSCEYGPFTSFRLTADMSGDYEGYSLNFGATEVGTMVKLQEASDAYKAWLGNYVLNTKSVKTGADTTYNVVLAEGLPNETILINGLGIDGMPLYYDAANDICNVKFGQFASGSTYAYYVSGITNENYVCMGNDDDLIAIATKATDNTISIESVSYDITEERTGVHAVYWGTLGYSASLGKWYTFSDVDYVVNPCTMTPAAAGTSVKSVANPTAGSVVKADRALKVSDASIAARVNAPAQKTIDARVAKSGKASVRKLVK